MTCICDILFGGRNSRGLFTRLGDDPQGLVSVLLKHEFLTSAEFNVY